MLGGVKVRGVLRNQVGNVVGGGRVARDGYGGRECLV